MSILGDEFDAAVNRLKNAANDFMLVYNQFANIPAAFRTSEWAGVKQQADYVHGTIRTIAASVDSAYRWAGETFGMSGLSAIGIAVPVAVPLTVAAIGAAVSAIMTTYGYMTEQLNKSSIVARVAEENIQRAKDGLPLLDPNTVIAQETGLFGDIGNAVKWAAIGGFVIFVVPKLLEKMKK